MKLKTKRHWIHFLTVITGIYIAYYIYWRATNTINELAVVFSVILLIAEIQGAINFLLFSMMTWKLTQKRTHKKLDGHSVDIFVPTYNEDVSVLEATLVGCLNIRMDHKTYVLDDGKRDEVRQLAVRLGANYLTREDNKHAKAGNINAALKHTDGEFIVVLDADMVPQPDYLEKTLGYFRDSKTAIVQLPQEFYNLDSMQYQRSGTHWHEQQLFYHVIQPGKDHINSAFWCGSPSIVRRKALEDIGGVATDSVTEDFLSSIRLNAKGWKIRYHQEALAFGIAPQSFNAFSVQRLRWAQGSMKILSSKDNPLFKKGLKFKQRLSHFAAMFTYFDAYQKLIYLLTPAILLFTGIMPIKVTATFAFMLHWIPYFILTMITNKVLGRGYFKYFEVEKFNTLKMVTFIRASFWLVFRRNLKFKVTPKTMDKTVKQKDQRELLIHMVILGVIIVSVAFGVVGVFISRTMAYPSKLAFGMAVFWAIFNSAVLLFSMIEVLRRVYYRKDYRFLLDAEGIVKADDCEGCECMIRNVSMGGMGLTFKEEEGKKIVKDKEIRVVARFCENREGIPGKIVYIKQNKDKTWTAGFEMAKLAEEQKIKCDTYLFVNAPRYMYEKSVQLQKKRGQRFKK